MTKRYRSTGVTDLRRLRAVARALLARLEVALEPTQAPDAPAVELQLQLLDRLLGAKTSLVASLVTLADLMIRLEAMTQGEADVMPPLSEADAALVEAFVRRMRQEGA